MRVAAVDDDVAVLQKRQKPVDHAVHGAARLDHNKDLAGLGEALNQLLQAVAADDVFAGGAAIDKVIHLGGGAIEDGHGEALGLHVHDQVFIHNGKADQADVCLFHTIISFFEWKMES